MIISNLARTYGVYQQNSKINSGKTIKENKQDTLALSSEAKDFQKVKSAISKTSDIRTDKVESIKSKIESGNYNISAEKIADKILENFA